MSTLYYELFSYSRSRRIAWISEGVTFRESKLFRLNISHSLTVRLSLNNSEVFFNSGLIMLHRKPKAG